MFSVLVFIAGAVVAEAGITRKHNTEIGLQFSPASSHIVRPVLRSQTLNPIGHGHRLNRYAPITNSFISPIVLNSPLINYAPLPISFPNTLKPNPAPIRASTITFISPSEILSSPSIGPTIRSPEINSSPVSHDILEPSLTHLLPPSPTVLSPIPTNHAEVPVVVNTHDEHTPIKSNEIIFETQQTPEKSVSYSISGNDYAYLQRHKTEGQDSPYNPVPGFDTAPIENHKNTHSHHGKGKDASHKHSDSDIELKNSASTNEFCHRFVEPSFVNAPEAKVFKHIYFHVPPPDYVEPRAAPVILPPPKKTYNILFIKAPHQEQQNYAYIQQLLQSRQPQIEDKTLIYVLSKKQDPVQVQVAPQPQQPPSSPEVFFVKYQTQTGDLTDDKNKLVDESLIESISPERKRSVDKA